MTKINYVIATWTGKRRKGNDPHTRDTTFYLKEHLRLLGKYKHSLSQITIVAPIFKKEPDKITEYIASLDGQNLGTTPVVVMRRENKGHSYGSYSHAFGQTRDNFDYYIFMEDDYAFVLDHFDKLLVSLFERDSNCGYLCGLVDVFGDTGKPHAAISNGIASNTSLQKVWDLKGELPSSDFSTKYHCQSQLQFSFGFLDAGLRLNDFTDTYQVIFNETGTEMRFGVGEVLMAPLQFKNHYPGLLG